MAGVKGMYHRDITWYNIYEIDGDDEMLVFTGNYRDVCKFLGISKSCITKAIKENHKVHKKYRIYVDKD